MPSSRSYSQVTAMSTSYHRLENRLGWRIVAKLDHRICTPSHVAGWLTWYAWNFIDNIRGAISIKILYDELIHQEKLYTSATNRNNRSIITLHKLTDRQTFNGELWSIRIGGIQTECICAIFEPSIKIK